ncbi:uncharacterized protein TNIN_148061 [Trichonephila inaurata madagascariensis]|uniref:Uncharacterized protein n=1 Tax=Trichonephila inaurata madagascariensis TaxID=2747483 RepID=A0A8X6XNM1_9ARAC|nr:uncharacterized protein TNIN_148061 [Trichonephila inaurata madagascariensis]
MITANIDVADGLANGTLGKLVGKSNWLLKVAGYANAKGIGREMVPINRRSATVPLNQSRSIHAKRNNFPLKPACSLTIHKSQGRTFDEIVYKYS